MANITFRDYLTKFNTDLSKLNPNELTLVIYDETNHTLQYSQLGYTFIATYLSPLFIPKKKFKYGILTQPGLTQLRYELGELLKNNLIDDLQYIPSIGKLKTSWYRILGSNSRVPSNLYTLNYVTITNKLLAKLLLRFFNGSSKTLYNLVK